MRKFVLLLSAVLLASFSMATAQNRQVSGTVLSSDGTPLPGVTVLVKGTYTGTSSDANGQYTINVPSGGTLEFSLIGMKTQEIPVDSRDRIDVMMDFDAIGMDEIVVTGYGVTRKAAFTGAAQVVGADIITSQTDANFMKSLQGNVAGLQMYNVNGQPGAFAGVSIRGIGSINSGTEPLYVVDGMPIYSDKLSALNEVGNGDKASSPLANINPNDIESVTVLKDATATAIYGSRAANGVIVITTKRGKSGTPRVNFLAKKGFSKIANLDRNYRTVQTDRYFDIWGQGLENSGEAAPGDGLELAKFYANYYYDWEEGVTPDTDWLKEILRTGMTDEYTIDVTGGSDNTSYYISGGYYRDQGIVRGTDMKRYSLRSNLEHSGKVFSFGLLSSVAYADNNNVPTESQYINPLVAVYDLRPIEPVYDANGDYNLWAYYNPIALIDKERGDIRNQRTVTASVNPYVAVNFGGGFIAKSNFGANLHSLREYEFAGMLNPQGEESHMYANQNVNNILNLTITNSLNWLRQYGKHDINLMVAHESQRLMSEQSISGAANFPYEGLTEMGRRLRPPQPRPSARKRPSTRSSSTANTATTTATTSRPVCAATARRVSAPIRAGASSSRWVPNTAFPKRDLWRAPVAG